MKRLACILLALTATAPAWSAGPKKITLSELKDQLTSLRQTKKSDEEVATQLKQVELTEQLAPALMTDFRALASGPLSTEQIYVLEARSSMLPPPPSDIPTDPAPSPADQQATLAKAQQYVADSYAKLPTLSATRMIARFQDLVETPPASGGGLHNGVSAEVDPIFSQYSSYIRLINTKTEQVDIENGTEKTDSKDKTPWGQNGIVASVGPLTPLDAAIQEIMASGSPRFLRWETIGGARTAVYSFAIDKKKTHFSVAYCCFPETDTTGTSHFGAIGGAGSSGDMTGNMQNVANWHDFHTKAGYHGELFIDPASGTIVRLITEADFKPSDFIHHQALRTDFEPRPIGGKPTMVPVRTFTTAETVPNGDSSAAHYAVRHQFVTEDLKDFHLAGTNAEK